MTNYEKILESYGFKNQLIKLAEESAELSAAIARHFTSDNGFEGIISEIADVLILLRQMGSVFGKDEIESEVEHKVQRQLDRISLDITKQR